MKHQKILTVGLSVLMSLFASLSAQTITVSNGDDSGPGSLREAISTAAGGDTIIFASELTEVTLTSAELIISSNLTITGGGVTVTRDTLAPLFRIFQVSQGVTANISGLTIRRGHAPMSQDGGGILNLGTLTLENCAISNNMAEDIIIGGSRGGGIYNGGNAFLNNCTITGNFAENNGGGIYNDGEATLFNCAINENETDDDGGGIYNDSTLALLNCTMNENVAYDGGGFINYGTANLDSCVIAGNDASGFGGGIRNGNGANLTLSNCKINLNDAGLEEGDGGGIDNGGFLTLNYCTVDSNGTRDSGGGIYNGGNAFLNNCTITGNFAENNGGGIYNNGEATLSNCAINENETFDDGGGISNSSEGNLTLNNCKVNLNVSQFSEGGGTGGGIDNGGFLVLNSCNVDSNYAEYGGGISNGSAGNTTLNDCIISDNESGFEGGGIYNEGVLSITGATIMLNRAVSSAGIYNGFGGNATINHCTISDNSVNDEGGGIENHGNFIIDNCTIRYNESYNGDGGGIYNSGFLTINSTAITSNRAYSGDGGNGGAGGIENDGDLAMANCLINGNELDSDYSTGSGGINNGGALELRNCVVSGNRVVVSGGAPGSGVRNDGDGSATLINCTVTGNETNGGSGGGIENQGGAFNIQNTIVAFNIADSAGVIEADIGGIITSQGYNLIGNIGSESFNAAIGDLVGMPGSPLDPLFVENAPPAPSAEGNFKLKQNSPAINAGSPDTTGLNLPALDLTGTLRILEDRIDIGALEFDPFNSLQVEVPDSVNAGEDLSISVIPPPGFIPETSQIYFRRGGESFYDAMDLINSGGNTYTVVLPQSAVTIRGVEYYILFSGGEQEITFPEVDPETNPAIINTFVSSLAHPLLPEKITYRMVSIPLALADRSVLGVFGDDYGTYDPGQWRALRWQSDAEQYAEPPEIADQFDPGNAFWLITREGQPFDVDNGRSVDTSQPFPVTVQPGWNQIGNPFSFPVDWNIIINAGQVEPPRYWDGQQYQPQQFVLDPWEGYFVHNPDSINPVVLLIPPVEIGGEFSKRSGLKLSASKSSYTQGEFVLQLKLTAAEANQKDEHNYVGMLNDALSGFDANDFLQPPSPAAGNIALGIMQNGLVYDGNFMPVSEEGMFWDLQVSSAGDAENLRLTIDRLQPFPSGFQIWLLDKDDQSSLPLSQGEVNLSISKGQDKKRLRLIAGTEEFAQTHNEDIFLEPLDFALQQNFPNPFNPETTLQYQLAKRAPVLLEIYNILGQRVVTLVNEIQKAGKYSLNWNGRDQQGNRVASGLYVYRLKADTFVETRKMVLTR